jgi:hypothetical protein
MRCHPFRLSIFTREDWLNMACALSQHRKWGKSDRIAVFFLILLPCTLRMWLQVPLNNDTFFLLSHGRYVLQHGWPTIEPFTFHEGLHFVMQQWLSATIFYYAYSLFDFGGLYILAYLVYLSYGYLGYKLSMLLSNNNLPVSATTSLAMCIGIGISVSLRPWIFSTIIIFVEIYCLELYINKEKYIYIIVLPILALLLVNLHAALWPMFFIIAIPYIIDGLQIEYKWIRFHGYTLLPIIICIVFSFVISFLNPYSFDAMTYLYNSYGNIYINSLVNEMRSPSFKDMTGILVYTMYASVALTYAIYKHGTTHFRYVFLMLITAYMGLSSARSLQYFFITIPFLAYYYRDFDILKTYENKRKPDIYTYIMIIILIISYTLVITKAPKNTEKKFFETFIPAGAVEYILDNLDVPNIRIFNDYDPGDYLAFRGIRPFIDTRADVFLKSNNKKEDILNDYCEVYLGKIHYLDFIEKYRFTHFLAVRGSLMDTYLSRDPDILLLYEDERYRVLQRKNR